MAPKQDPKPKFQEGKIRYRKALTESSVRRILSFSRCHRTMARVHGKMCIEKQF